MNHNENPMKNEKKKMKENNLYKKEGFPRQARRK
jgi:hypothetical protein